MTLNPDGTYTYALDNTNPTVQQLAPGETLAETYTYVLTDEDGDTSTATLTVTITGAEDLPVATANTNTVNEGVASVSGNVKTDGTPDTNGDGTPAQNTTAIQGSPTGSYGTVTLNPMAPTPTRWTTPTRRSTSSLPERRCRRSTPTG